MPDDKKPAPAPKPEPEPEPEPKKPEPAAPTGSLIAQWKARRAR